jgi:hypothetical protein
MSSNGDRVPPRALRLVRGGLADGGLRAKAREWRRFCTRIGWQEPHAPALPADYEARLLARLFERDDQAPPSSAAARRSWIVALAVAALVAGVAVVALTIMAADPAPPTTAVPKRVPEVVEAPKDASTVEEPVERAPVAPNQKKTPDPGGRRVWAAAPRGVDPRKIADTARPSPRAAAEPRALAASPIDPDRGPDEAAKEPPAAPPPALLLAAASPELAPEPAPALEPRIDAVHAAASAPPWLGTSAIFDLELSAPRETSGAPAGVRVMTQVDVAALGRRLFEQP